MGANQKIEIADKRVETLAKKMLKTIGEIDENQKDIVKSLVEEAAFMRVTLQNLRTAISVNGVVDTYQNGENQSGRKKSTEVDIYNTMIKNYNATVKQIIDVVSKQPGRGDVSDGFEEFTAMR